MLLQLWLLKLTRIQKSGDLDQWYVPDRVNLIIVDGKGSELKPGDNSRSVWLYDVVCNLIRCGVLDEIMLGIITDPDWKISESVLDKDAKAVEYAQRNISKAPEEIHSEFDVRGKTGHP